MSKASVEEMKKQAQRIVENAPQGACWRGVLTYCGECWLNYCCGASPREERYQLARAILEDRVIWHEGELCVVED